ncbi:GAP family protein [Brachybacterium huguangmaarense]|uniref:GAP family protein n=1 Tax=Brachybacterium huguangmaarense TaxID=1652028 RepID=A0ABY6G1W9_9MICO|nr:GAP family protein [Brachybacterium huguangmaarense]UYG17102.1 GAP family protein [Brachybacterium huguangmaarense]
MDALLVAAGPLGLVLLALLDSTSVGTLVVPVILLVTGREGARRVAGRTLVYLATIGLFYLALGIGLLAGQLPLIDRAGPLLAAPGTAVVIALVGVALVVWSHRTDPATIRKRGGDPEASARRWTDRVRSTAGRPGALVALALLAGLVEAVSMVPYLAAMGIIAGMGIGLGHGALVLVGYCLVMIAPAAVLCALRALLGSRADSALERAHDWAVKHAASAFSWAVGIIGVLLLVRSVGPALGVLTGG